MDDFRLPKIANVNCFNLMLEPDDKVIITVSVYLEFDQFKQITKTVQEWAGKYVEVALQLGQIEKSERQLNLKLAANELEKRPRIQEVELTRHKFEPGSRLIAKVTDDLDRHQKKKLRKAVQKYTGPDVEILIVDSRWMEISVVKANREQPRGLGTARGLEG